LESAKKKNYIIANSKMKIVSEFRIIYYHRLSGQSHKLNKKTKKLIMSLIEFINTLINESFFLVDTVSSLITALTLVEHSAFFERAF